MTTASALQDAIAISSLFADPELDSELEFATRQLEYLTPSSTTYSLSVNFDTLSLGDRWVEWSQAYLALPITITTAAALVPAPVFPAIAFKSSALSILNGVVIKQGNGQQLVDERHVGAFANHLRLAFEKDQDWLTMTAPEIHFSRDRCLPGVAGLNTTAKIQNPCIAKYTAIPGPGIAVDDGNFDNPCYNQGFHERSQYLLRSCYSDVGAPPAMGGTSLSCWLRIPLSVIHDFFKQLSFPLTNTRLSFEFYLQTTAVSNFNPVCLGSAISNIAGGQTQAAGGACAVSITAGSTPRLYYHSVQLKPEQNALAAAKLASGYRKVFDFREYDMYKDAAPQLNVANGTSVNYLVSSSAVAAQKLWVLCYPTGLIDGTTWPSTLVTGPNGLTNFQVSLNNRTFFNNPLSTLDEQYAIVKESMHLGADSGDAEALLPYQDFRLTSRLLCVPLRRAHNQAADPNAPVTIQVTGTVSAPAPIDIVYIVERLRRVEFDFSAGSTRVLVGPALYQQSL